MHIDTYIGHAEVVVNVLLVQKMF